MPRLAAQRRSAWSSGSAPARGPSRSAISSSGSPRSSHGHRDPSALGRLSNPHVPWLGIAFVVVAPAVGGLLYGPLIARFAPEARGHGVPEVMLAVAERGGRISPKVAVVKSLASAICIGSGGSVGREGPIVQIGSALGSTSASSSASDRAAAAAGRVRRRGRHLGHLQRPDRRSDVRARADPPEPRGGALRGRGARVRRGQRRRAGGVRRSPVPGARRLPPRSRSPSTRCTSVSVCVAALVGVTFIHVLYAIEDLCDHVWPWPDALRPAAGGLLLGLLLLALPEMYGVGYPVLQRAISGRYVIGFLLLLLIAKMLATSLTIGIGGSGGIFAPSLFLGAMLGGAYGQALNHLLPHQTAPAGAYALVGMAAVFAAAARAPITAVLIVFELTGDYRIILPLMCATVVATTLSSILSRETIYSLKLTRRGIDILQREQPTLLQVADRRRRGATDARRAALRAPTRTGRRPVRRDRRGVAPGRRRRRPPAGCRAARRRHGRARERDAGRDGSRPREPARNAACGRRRSRRRSSASPPRAGRCPSTPTGAAGSTAGSASATHSTPTPPPRELDRPPARGRGRRRSRELGLIPASSEGHRRQSVSRGDHGGHSALGARRTVECEHATSGASGESNDRKQPVSSLYN